MSFKAIVIGLAVVAGSIALLRMRAWYRRTEQRAPLGMQIALTATVIIALLLAAADLVPLDTTLPFAVALSLIGVVWGWVRYHRSPYLRRWEATWKQIDTHLASDDQDAADRLLTAAHQQDDVEREELRAAAPHDRRAAREFQRRTKAELKNQSLVLSTRKQRLEADLDWIRSVLSGPSGGALN